MDRPGRQARAWAAHRRFGALQQKFRRAWDRTEDPPVTHPEIFRRAGALRWIAGEDAEALASFDQALPRARAIHRAEAGDPTWTYRLAEALRDRAELLGFSGRGGEA